MLAGRVVGGESCGLIVCGPGPAPVPNMCGGEVAEAAGAESVGAYEKEAAGVDMASDSAVPDSSGLDVSESVAEAAGDVMAPDSAGAGSDGLDAAEPVAEVTVMTAVQSPFAGA